jgi:hypothetical protein
LHIAEQLHLLTSSGRIATLLAMPPAWVDFAWELVRVERDDVKWISVVFDRILIRKGKYVALRKAPNEEGTVHPSVRAQVAFWLTWFQSPQQESLVGSMQGRQPALSSCLQGIGRHSSLSMAESYADFSIWLQYNSGTLQEGIDKLSIAPSIELASPLRKIEFNAIETNIWKGGF